MSEIPLLPDDENHEYEEEVEKTSNCARNVLAGIGLIVIIVIAGIFLINTALGPQSYNRDLYNRNDIDVDTLPHYYYGEVSVSQAETLTSIPPRIEIHIVIEDRGTDQWEPYTIHAAVLDIDESTFETLSFEQVDAYIITETAESDEQVYFDGEVFNNPHVYVWLIWFECNKTVNWEVDMSVHLEYNIRF